VTGKGILSQVGLETGIPIGQQSVLLLAFIGFFLFAAVIGAPHPPTPPHPSPPLSWQYPLSLPPSRAALVSFHSLGLLSCSLSLLFLFLFPTPRHPSIFICSLSSSLSFPCQAAGTSIKNCYILSVCSQIWLSPPRYPQSSQLQVNRLQIQNLSSTRSEPATCRLTIMCPVTLGMTVCRPFR
jgi:hypothetical protein